MNARLPYPPPWQDIATLCEHISIAPSTVDLWVKRGLLPTPKLRGGKRLWKWTEVEKYLEGEDERVNAPLNDQAEGITNATRQALAESRKG